MRLSPVFVAVFGFTATVGLSNSANGQTSPACFTSSPKPLGTLYNLYLDRLLPPSTILANFSPVLDFSQTDGDVLSCEDPLFSSIDSAPQIPLQIFLDQTNETTISPFYLQKKVSKNLVFNDVQLISQPVFQVSLNHSQLFDLNFFDATEKSLVVLSPTSISFNSLDHLQSENLERNQSYLDSSLNRLKAEAKYSDEIVLNKIEEVKPELRVETSEDLVFAKSKLEEYSDEIVLNKIEEVKPELRVETSEDLVFAKSKLEEYSDEIVLNKIEEVKPELRVETSEDLVFAKSKLEEYSDEIVLNKIEEVKPELRVETSEDLVFAKSKLNREPEPQNTLYKLEENQPEQRLFQPEIRTEAALTQTQSTQLGEPLEQQPVELSQASSGPEFPSRIQPENNRSQTSQVPVPAPLPPIPILAQQTQSEAQVLVAEVVVEGVDDPVLEERVYTAISTLPGRTTTRSQLQQDINAIFALGFFRNVRAVPEDTPLGVRITFDVEPNPPLGAVIIEGDSVLPPEVVEQSFAGQFNRIINLNEIEEAIQRINSWYQENGYVLAQVIEAPQVTPDGTITLVVAEGEIENIRVRFLTSDGELTDPDGNPIRGKTQDYIIIREIELEPGDIFNQRTAQQDLSRIFALGIFEDVRLQLEPGSEDPRKATMVVNIVERRTGSLVLGGGVSSATGLFGTVSYQEQNINGRNQRLATEVQAGERILLLDVSFTDPWIDGDPFRTSYTTNVFRRQAISVIFEQEDDDKPDIRLPNGDRPRVVRTGGGITFTRPFAENVFSDPNWVVSLGVQYQHVQIADADLRTTPRDEAGKLLSQSSSGEDDLLTVQLGIARDRRNNIQFPTSGYAFRFGTEQAIPVGSGDISFNRVRGSFSYYLPVEFLQLVPGGPQTIAFNFQGGTVIGEFPPYEAFALGGANTVRGWREGHLAAARSFVLGSVEYRFPVFAVSNFLIGGAIFIDAASSLGTQSSVSGNPGGIRGKPGEGLGFGAGVRIQSPLGPIRIDYGVSDEGDSRIHFGVGERF